VEGVIVAITSQGFITDVIIVVSKGY